MDGEKVRVLQYVKVLERGGLESFVLNYAKAVQEYGIEFDYLVLREQIEPYEDEIRGMGGKKIVVNINQKNLLMKEVTTFFNLYRYFKNCGYKIVHFESITPSIQGNVALLAAKIAGVRVRIVHSHIAPRGWEDYKGFKRLKYIITKRMNSQLGTDFFACSDIAAKYAFTENVLNGGHYVKIRNSIDIERYGFNSEYRNLYRLKLKVEDKCVIGNVARFVKQKNHGFIIDVLEELLRYKKDYILLLIGEKSDSEPDVFRKIKEDVKKRKLEKFVIFLGGISDVYKYLNVMDIFLLPSLFEGLPVSLIEAQASGLQCFVSDTISMETKITDHVHFLPLLAGAKKWAEQIENIMLDDRDNDKEKVIRAGYDMKENAIKLANIYRRMNVSELIS